MKHQGVEIDIDDGSIQGDLAIPDDPKGIVIFAHGSGSSRFSPRNRMVAKRLNEDGLATHLVDLLTEEEEQTDVITSEYRFAIDFLAARLEAATLSVKEDRLTKNLPVGYFGASTGAAAALLAAAKTTEIKAIVSRGGRPDLVATEILEQLTMPILLIVGGNDFPVIDLNHRVFQLLKSSKEKKFVTVPKATHLFEEPGTLEQVAELASSWFKKYLVS